MSAQEEHPGGAVLVPLAEGFEEIEAVTIVDVLRRAGLPVVVAGLAPGPVTGSHGITLGTDRALDDVEVDSLRALVLPGGMPGARNLREDARVLAIARTLHAEERVVAAICAAPIVLEAAGVLGTGPATSHASVRDRLGSARVVADQRVVRSGRVFTSQGAGTALEFALALVEELVGADRARELGRAMVVAGVGAGPD